MSLEGDVEDGASPVIIQTEGVGSLEAWYVNREAVQE